MRVYSEKEIITFFTRIVGLQKNQKKIFFLSSGSWILLYPELFSSIDPSHNDISFVQVDERFQPENKEDINAFAIAKTGILDKNRPSMMIPQDGALEDAVKKYEEKITPLFLENVYKIALLGIGEDGHTAGMLPGYEKEWNLDSYVAGYKNNGKFPQRITLTPKALKLMDETIVYAVGEKKLPVIQKLLDHHKGKNLGEFPVGILNEMKNVHLFTDKI